MRVLTAFFAALFLLSSCSPRLSDYTNRLQKSNDWSEDELRQIQFYLSSDIVLKRQIKEGSSEIVNGKIKMENGRQIEEILIPRKTPGVFLFSPKTERCAVAFEGNSESRFLMFGPNPKAGNRYVLLASDWDKRRGKVTYDGKIYYVDSQSAFAGLQVDLRRIRKTKVSSRVAKGRKID